jgi:hypothetical protein
VIAKRRRLITSGLTPGAATSTYECTQKNHPFSPSVSHPPASSRLRRALAS